MGQGRPAPRGAKLAAVFFARRRILSLAGGMKRGMGRGVESACLRIKQSLFIHEVRDKEGHVCYQSSRHHVFPSRGIPRL